MKHEFHKKNIKLSNNYKKWAYAAVATGILVTGAQTAIHNTESHAILAKAAGLKDVKIKIAKDITVYVYDLDYNNYQITTGTFSKSDKSSTSERNTVWTGITNAIGSSANAGIYDLSQMPSYDPTTDPKTISGYDSTTNTIKIYLHETPEQKAKVAAKSQQQSNNNSSSNNGSSSNNNSSSNNGSSSNDNSSSNNGSSSNDNSSSNNGSSSSDNSNSNNGSSSNDNSNSNNGSGSSDVDQQSSGEGQQSAGTSSSSSSAQANVPTTYNVTVRKLYSDDSAPLSFTTDGPKSSINVDTDIVTVNGNKTTLSALIQKNVNEGGWNNKYFVKGQNSRIDNKGIHNDVDANGNLDLTKSVPQVFDYQQNKVTVNFIDGKNQTKDTETFNGVPAYGNLDLTSAFDAFGQKNPNMQLDPSNAIVKSKTVAMDEGVTSVDIPVQYLANIAKVDENGNKTGDNIKVASSTPTMSANDLNKALADQGYATVTKASSTLDLTNPSSTANLYATKSGNANTQSTILVVLKDQRNNLITRKPFTRTAGSDVGINIDQLLSQLNGKKDPNNIYESLNYIPASYSASEIVLNVILPENNLTVNFVDKNGNKLNDVQPYTQDGITFFEPIDLSNKIEDLKKDGYTLVNSDDSRILLFRKRLDPKSDNFVLNIKLDKATQSNTASTGNPYTQTVNLTDANGNAVTDTSTRKPKTAEVSLNSVDGKMTPDEYASQMAKAGYTLTADQLKALENQASSNGGVIMLPQAAVSAYPNPKVGTTYPATVNVNGKSITLNLTADGSGADGKASSVSKASLVAQLAKQGITVDPSTIPSDSTDLSKPQTFNGTNNATAGSTTSYPQTLNTVDANGNAKEVTFAINSASSTMDPNQYIKAINDAGYSLTKDQEDAIKKAAAKNNGVIDLNNPSSLPTVTANANAKVGYNQKVTVKNPDGSTSEVTLPINSSSNTMSKADFVKALVDAGYTPIQDTVNNLSGNVDLNQPNNVEATPNVTNAVTTSYSQPVNTTDASGKSVQKTANINSDQPTISKADYIKQMADQGFAIDPSTITDDPIDLSKLANSPVTAGNNNSAASNNYPVRVNLVDANGNPKKDANGNQETATVNIPSNGDQMSKNDFVAALNKAGYTLSDKDKAQLGDIVSLKDINPVDASSKTANPTKEYSQTVEVKDANGNVISKSLPINSDQPTISKADYVAKLIDAGYTPEDVAKLPDQIDLTQDVKPTVKANANAATTYIQNVNVPTADGKTATVPVAISSTKPNMDKASFIKALADKGFTVADPSQLADSVQLGANNVDATKNAGANTSYPQTLSAKLPDGTTKEVKVGVTSANPTMGKDAYKKALADLGYTIDDSELNKLGDPVHLDSQQAVTVSANDSSETSHSQALKVKQADGTYKDVNININNHGDTMSKADYIKELLDQGYTVADPSSLPDTINLNNPTPTEVSENTNATPTYYSQTIKLQQADGTTKDVPVNVNSDSKEISKADYVRALASVGYTVLDPESLSTDSNGKIDLGANNTNPVVLPNNQAHVVTLNVNGRPVQVNVGNDGNNMSKSDLIDALAKAGYKVTNPDDLTDPADLSNLPELQAKPYTGNYSGEIVNNKNVAKFDGNVVNPVISKDGATPLITKQELVNKLEDQGYTISDLSALNDVINLDNSVDTKKIADLLKPYAPYEASLQDPQTGDSVVLHSQTKEISKQSLEDALKSQGYTITNPEVLKGENVDVSNPDSYKDIVIAKISDNNNGNSTNNTTNDTTSNSSNNANNNDGKVSVNKDKGNNHSSNKSDKKSKKRSKKHSVIDSHKNNDKKHSVIDSHKNNGKKHIVIDNHKNNYGKSTTNGANKNGSLPQTGDATNQSRSAGFGLIATIMGSILAFFGLKRRKNNDD